MMRSGERYVVEGVRARAWGVDCDVINASSGGLFLASSSPPPIGQALTLELALDQGRPISMNGRVVWINDGQHPSAEQLPRGFGVRIQRLGLSEKLTLLKFLQRQRPVVSPIPAGREERARGQ
jgi:hypothetical protein